MPPRAFRFSFCNHACQDATYSGEGRFAWSSLLYEIIGVEMGEGGGEATCSCSLSVPSVSRALNYVLFVHTVRLVCRITSRIVGNFSACTRDFGWVECTAPPGTGRTDDNFEELRIGIVQPGLHCDPTDQGTQVCLSTSS